MLKSISSPVKSSFNSIKVVYLLLTIAGTITPWFWLLQDPAALLSPSLLLQATFANAISTAWVSDLLISAAAFFGFAWIELNRLEASRLWLLFYIGLTFGVGLSCALPFFLYRREQILERNAFQ
ncbi:MAG: DUF2834 domain-containing protein [Aphanocapsa sp. GSE-SYN-MK-11-07L]|jgi:hypothetical protein|nr:DUF2834 domain-containing protein [Aphanocapsa sp. GSE-SYN-MK-11-07L]